MIKHNGLLLAFSSLLVGGLPFNKLFVADAAGMHDDNNSVKTITCRSGWNGNSEIAIPHEWMDDGYCDCPFDGKDEPNTNACSGSLSWAGVDTSIR